ncbi:hypothetical protein MKK55_15770 [Methylobacterium sp. J-059]|uniref:hypothetical protein n=1 Tax=Methylobacterium sp. J-059 TaxID=2836643 RepID=UPI001FB9E161|nr:hypothetical protein [Methylobacterium sp. J-059]MCJ2040391.1 hypothetical protein [Methylobacterium sp. J-059]
MPHCFSDFAAGILRIWLTSIAPAYAQDDPITLADDPFEVSDPHATSPGESTFSIGGSYERAATGRVRGTAGAESELSYGVAPKLDVRIGQTGAYGNLDIRRRLGTVSADVPGSTEGGTKANLGGTTRLGALYQITDESKVMPIVGLLGRVRALYGPGGTAYETEGTLLFGKTLRSGELPLGVSLNLGGVYRFDPAPGERTTRALLNASVGQAISTDTALVATYAREQQELGQPNYSLVQVGARHRVKSQRAILGVAVGFGLNRNTPQLQLAVAIQWEFGGAR